MPTHTIRAFASHDWGLNGANHARVSQVVDGLRKRGVEVWFDETHMRGNILSAMCTGIDSSDVILVFVTNNYIQKVEKGNDADNVRREFMYAAERHPTRCHAIRFEETPKWTGPVGMVLGTRLYTDMVAISEGVIDTLVRNIQHDTGKALWKTCTRRVLATTPLQHRRPPPLPRCVPKNVEGIHLKGRVTQAFEAMGTAMRDGEHTRDALERLLLSVVGDRKVDLPFHERVKLVEKELGLMEHPL